MKKHWKTWMATLLCLVLFLATGLPALAQSAPTPEESAPVSESLPQADPGTEGEAPSSPSEETPAETPETGEEANAEESGAEETPPESEPTPAPTSEEGNSPETPSLTPAEPEPEHTPETENDPGEEDLETEEPQEEPEAREEEKDIEKTQAYGLVLDAQSIVVTSYEELKKALSEDNGFTTVYLGANITADGTGVSLHPGKARVVIDGSPPAGGRYTFTQYPSDETNRLIRVDDANATTTEVVLRNLDITGKSAFGVVWVRDSLPGVALTLENVAYTGPQPVHHRNGTARFWGGRYTLAGGELAEALHVEFGGELHIGAANTANSILWLVSGSSTFTVAKNARVAVETNYYFIFGSPASATLEAGASFSLTSRRFGFTYAGDSVGTFTLGENAELTIDLNTPESYAALRVSRRFEMAPGSAATLLRTGTAGIALRLTASGAQVVFNQPRRVFLYSSAGVPLRFTGAGTLSLTATALNTWAKTAWPLPGGMQTLPSHIWNKAGGTPLTLTGSYSETLNQGLTHNLTGEDPIASALNAQNFDLEHSQLVAFGSGALSLDVPTNESSALTGGADPHAELQADYTLADERGGATGGSAGADGHYRLPLEDGALLVGSEATVTARANGLFLRQRATVQDGGSLAFAAVPEAIHFGPLPVPDAQNLAERQQPVLALSVRDTRPNPSPWRIDASLAHPLAGAAPGGESRLPSALVFKTKQGETHTLNEAPRTVYRQESGGGSVDIQWKHDEGVLLNMVPGQVYSGAEYSTTIHWALVDAP